jgi:hypothetical protein
MLGGEGMELAPPLISVTPAKAGASAGEKLGAFSP